MEQNAKRLRPLKTELKSLMPCFFTIVTKSLKTAKSVKFVKTVKSAKLPKAANDEELLASA